jgi:2-dehydropantoate 2-reductase
VRIAIMAAGAVGGYFGGRLAEAGHEVGFVARGAHLAALREDGLKITSPVGDLHLKKVTATDNPSEIGPVDFVLFAVKLWDTDAAAALTKPLIGPDTAVITLQNGIESIAHLDPVLGSEHVVGGLTYIGARVQAPGAIGHVGKLADIRCGERDGSTSPRLQAFAAAAKQAGFDCSISNNIEVDIWKKFVFLVGFSGITTVTRRPFGDLHPDADCRALFRELMQETLSVGLARGVALPADFADERLAFSAKLPPATKSSMLYDLERGNRLELDWLAGAVVRMGREAKVATPANAAVYAALKPWRMGARN